jgi:ACS family allantoate permease-like MFS transporter
MHALEFFLASQAPVYDLAFRMLSKSFSPWCFMQARLLTMPSRTVGCYSLMIIVPVLQYLWYRYENNRRDRVAIVGGGAEEVARMEFSDETDFERWRTFRYTL